MHPCCVLLDGPTVTDRVVVVTEYTPLTLNCSYDADPEPHTIRWTDPYGGSPPDPLTFNDISRSWAGEYTCTVYNILELSGENNVINHERSGSGVTTVDVQCKYHI